MSPEDLQALATAVADELERRAKAAQPAPFDPGPRVPTTTELALGRLKMSAEVMQPMLDATPDAMLRDIARDRHASAPRSAIPPREGVPPTDLEPKQVNTSGWRNPRPLKSGLQQ